MILAVELDPDRFKVCQMSGSKVILFKSYCRHRQIQGVFFKAYQTYRATPPTFLIWNNLCELVYQPPTRSYRSQTVVNLIATPC